MTNILTGIADEAGAGLESQIRATKALGWHPSSFFSMANVNLGLVVVITFIVALWRWW